MNRGEGKRFDVEDPDVPETFPAVGTAEDDEFAAHHVGGVVASGFGLGFVFD